MQMRHSLLKNTLNSNFTCCQLSDHCTLIVLFLFEVRLGPLIELSYGYCPFRPQCKHGTDTRPIIFVKDIQWKQGRERALNPWQGAYTMAHGVCTGHTSGSWDNWECLSSFQPLQSIYTCIQYIQSIQLSAYIQYMFLVVIVVISNLLYAAVCVQVALVEEINDLNGSYLIKYGLNLNSTYIHTYIYKSVKIHIHIYVNYIQ